MRAVCDFVTVVIAPLILLTRFNRLLRLTMALFALPEGKINQPGGKYFGAKQASEGERCTV
jgi:hypothetical protein